MTSSVAQRSLLGQLLKERAAISLVVVAVALALIYGLVPRDNQGPGAWRYWTAKVKCEGCASTVLVGTSRFYRGLSASRMQESLGGSVYNFGFSAQGYTPVFLDGAERALAKDGPREIVLDMTPVAFAPFAVRAGHYPRWQKALAEKSPMSELRWRVDELFPRLSFCEVFRGLCPYRFKQSFEADGFVRTERSPCNENDFVPTFEKAFGFGPVAEENIELVAARVRAWTQQGIRVFALRPPVPEPMRELEQTRGRFVPEQTRRIMEEAGAIWLDVPDRDWRSCDGSHLEASAADELSVVVANLILKQRDH